jgi:hypothetical protein
MKNFNQRFLAAKIEYHWWRIRNLRKKKSMHKDNPDKLDYAENLHRYKAEKASIEYEISVGLRDCRGAWQNAA